MAKTTMGKNDGYEYMTVQLKAGYTPDDKKLRTLLSEGWEILNQSATAQVLGFGKQTYQLRRAHKSQSEMIEDRSSEITKNLADIARLKAERAKIMADRRAQRAERKNNRAAKREAKAASKAAKSQPSQTDAAEEA